MNCDSLPSLRTQLPFGPRPDEEKIDITTTDLVSFGLFPFSSHLSNAVYTPLHAINRMLGFFFPATLISLPMLMTRSIYSYDDDLSVGR
jgi:hypothetical protein